MMSDYNDIHCDKLKASLAAIDDMFENMSPKEFKKDLEKVMGIYPNGETVDDFLNSIMDGKLVWNEEE